jgi:hypothetical protein
LEELFEAFTWLQLGLHHKPVGLLNVAGFYDRLIDFLVHMREQGFLKPAHLETLVVEESVEHLLDRFAEFNHRKTLGTTGGAEPAQGGRGKRW